MTIWKVSNMDHLAQTGHISALPPLPEAVTPATVLAARRGFLESFVHKGFGTFEGNDVQRAEDFFDDQANKGHWSNEFYRRYAQMDPWKEDE